MWLGRYLLVVLLISCARHPASGVVAEVAGTRAGAVEVRVDNRTQAAILLISPTTPNRQWDEDHCAVLLSTKVQESILPYAFTPELVELEAGHSRTFTVDVQNGASPKCRDWRVDLEYVYVPSKEALPVQRQDTDAFRGYVLTHQQIAGR